MWSRKCAIFSKIQECFERSRDSWNFALGQIRIVEHNQWRYRNNRRNRSKSGMRTGLLTRTTKVQTSHDTDSNIHWQRKHSCRQLQVSSGIPIAFDVSHPRLFYSQIVVFAGTVAIDWSPVQWGLLQVVERNWCRQRIPLNRMWLESFFGKHQLYRWELEMYRNWFRREE